MQNTQALNIIKQDYANLLNDHLVLFVTDLEIFFDKYPQIEGLSFGQKSFIVNGAFVNKANAIVEKNFGDYEKKQVVKYYAYTQDNEGQDERLLNLFEKYETFFEAYYQITMNPYFKTLSLESTYSSAFLKQDINKSITQFFGKNCAQYYSTIKEKKSIEASLASSDFAPNKDLTKPALKTANKL